MRKSFFTVRCGVHGHPRGEVEGGTTRLETASISTGLDFGRYRHAQEVTDSMSIETVDARARAAAPVALVRQRAPKRASSRSRRDRCPTIRGISR